MKLSAKDYFVVLGGYLFLVLLITAGLWIQDYHFSKTLEEFHDHVEHTAVIMGVCGSIGLLIISALLVFKR
ncbi:MAG: hypothetical protein JWM20_954 [Patescibacteria group bacterium]|nr:hypothetical protein [Patescibacteria group bacterium]